MAREGHRNLSWNVSVIVLMFGLVGVLLQCRFISALQTHQGSAPTNEFTLTGIHPDARIHIDSSNTIIIINVDPPSPSSNPYKVGLELLSMQLCDLRAEDRLKVVYSDPTTIKTVTWKANVSFPSIFLSSSPSEEEDLDIKDIQVNQIVLIPEGRWITSKADLVATLYQDAFSDGTCPPSTIPCSCMTSNAISKDSAMTIAPTKPIRCIPQSLECNGNPNCGLQCNSDENGASCHSSSLTSFFPSSTPCAPEPPTKRPTVTASTTQSLGGTGGGGGSIRQNSFIIFIATTISALFYRNC